MTYLSIEYARPLWKKLEGFVFCDAGSLSLDNFGFDRLYTSAGVGCRFKIFESGPPLTIALGYPFNPKSHGQVKWFFMQVGGRF